MAVADFSLPPWLAQSNTDLVPNAMAKGAAVGASIAHAMQGAAQIRQAQQRISLMQAEDARQQQEFQQKAQAEAMRYQGFQNFARDREILKAQGANEDFASQQALMKNLHLITSGDPKALASVLDKTTDNARQAQYLGLQRDRLAEAHAAAIDRQKLEQENFELRRDRKSPGALAADELLKATEETNRAKGLPPMTEVERATQRAQLLTDAFPAKGTETTEMGTDAEGRQFFRVTKGKEASRNIATENLAQKRILDDKEYVARADQAIAQSTPEAFGIRGQLNDLRNKLVAQVAPEAANLDVAKQRVVIGDIMQKQLTAYDRMGRLTQSDRDKIEKLGPTTGWADSYERSVRAMQTMANIRRKSALVDALTTAQKPEQWMVKGLSDQDFLDLKNNGMLTREQAIQAYDALHPK